MTEVTKKVCLSLFCVLGLFHLGYETRRPQPRALKQTDESRRKHHPTYFTEEIQISSIFSRGNFLYAQSSCNMARWVYMDPVVEDDWFKECRSQPKAKKFKTASSLQELDTIYVPFSKVDHFVQHVLPDIVSKFVLISGQNRYHEPLKCSSVNKLLRNDYLIHWFMQNKKIYGACDYEHAKLSPFPYGLKKANLEIYAKEFNRSNVVKKKLIFLSNLSDTSQERKHIPSGPRLGADEFFRQMHRSQYVLSPDGDRPDCYRHYEAIGLGTVPITELDPFLYKHLAPAPVIFNQTVWELSHLRKTLPRNIPSVNRRMVFEEYWMEYVERIVGTPVWWWDKQRGSRCLLSDLM